MITEVVNGELKQVFDFSAPDIPAKFYGPIRIGSGIRRRVEIARAKSLVASGAITLAIQTMMSGKKKPNGMTPEQWADQLQNEAQEMLIANIDADNIGNQADMECATLEVLLTPAEGSLSVKTWYESYSEESQVAEIINFSVGLASDKIATEPEPTHSGKAIKSARKVADR